MSLAVRPRRRLRAGVSGDGGVEHLHPLAALAINLLKTNKVPNFN